MSLGGVEGMRNSFLFRAARRKNSARHYSFEAHPIGFISNYRPLPGNHYISLRLSRPKMLGFICKNPAFPANFLLYASFSVRHIKKGIDINREMRYTVIRYPLSVV